MLVPTPPTRIEGDQTEDGNAVPLAGGRRLGAVRLLMERGGNTWYWAPDMATEMPCGQTAQLTGDFAADGAPPATAGGERCFFLLLRFF